MRDNEPNEWFLYRPTSFGTRQAVYDIMCQNRSLYCQSLEQYKDAFSVLPTIGLHYAGHMCDMTLGCRQYFYSNIRPFRAVSTNETSSSWQHHGSHDEKEYACRHLNIDDVTGGMYLPVNSTQKIYAGSMRMDNTHTKAVLRRFTMQSPPLVNLCWMQRLPW